MNCPFCYVKERVLRENDLAQLFLSNPRKVKGHFLVTPKRHIEQPWQLTSDELLATFELISFVQQHIVGKLAAGVDIRQNYRPFLPESRTKVDHVHFHIIPRDLHDELYQRVEQHETQMFAELSEEESKEIEALLK